MTNLSQTTLCEAYSGLKRQVEALGPSGPGRRLPPDLRDALGVAVRKLRDAGETWASVEVTLGISVGLAGRLVKEVRGPEQSPPVPVVANPAAPVFRPVEIERPQKVRLVAPNGWVIEVEDIEVAVNLLERLGQR